MRVRDLVSPAGLCRQHLLGEHREIHAIHAIIVEDRLGYANHPEVARWRGRLPALWDRHEWVVSEMEYRGYAHGSPLAWHDGSSEPPEPWDDQLASLRAKGCCL